MYSITYICLIRYWHEGTLSFLDKLSHIIGCTHILGLRIALAYLYEWDCVYRVVRKKQPTPTNFFAIAALFID